MGAFYGNNLPFLRVLSYVWLVFRARRFSLPNRSTLLRNVCLNVKTKTWMWPTSFALLWQGNESRFWQTALHASVSPRAVLASSCAAAPLPPRCSLAGGGFFRDHPVTGQQPACSQWALTILALGEPPKEGIHPPRAPWAWLPSLPSQSSLPFLNLKLVIYLFWEFYIWVFLSPTLLPTPSQIHGLLFNYFIHTHFINTTCWLPVYMFRTVRWHWITHLWACPWRRLILPLSAAISCL